MASPGILLPPLLVAPSSFAGRIMIIICPRADNDHYPPCKNSGRAHYPPSNEEGAIICPVHGNYPALCLLTKSALLYKNGFKDRFLGDF